jgi:hypothetical protein
LLKLLVKKLQFMIPVYTTAWVATGRNRGREKDYAKK